MLVLDSIISTVSTVLERVLPDPKAKAAALLELQKLQQSGDLAAMVAQTDINKVEAASPNWFTSGWRPACGWICAAVLLFQFVIAPLVEWVTLLFNHPIKVPNLDAQYVYTILTGMLGLGGLRTVEKLQGVAR